MKEYFKNLNAILKKHCAINNPVVKHATYTGFSNKAHLHMLEYWLYNSKPEQPISRGLTGSSKPTTSLGLVKDMIENELLNEHEVRMLYLALRNNCIRQVLELKTK